MTKIRIILLFAVLFFINNVSFAVEEVPAPSKFPDYAREFTGRDKCESFNRKLFIFNKQLNKYILRPVNIAWASIMPQYGMDRIKCVHANINFPTRLVSCVLQKDFKTLKQETKRFAINTTLGVGGLYDVAQTKYKLEPRAEDMPQALAHFKRIKQGPYLFLPIIHGNVRDDVGQILNYPLNPCAYVLGPFSIVATAAFFINNSTYLQPLIKKVELTYADPYELIRQADGVSNYIKNSNLDRKEIFEQKTSTENIVPINHIADFPELKPDVRLSDYNPQSPLIDAMRTTMFDNGEKFNKTIWADISLWNRGFDKQIKLASTKVYAGRNNYRYRYILQKDKNAPVAIIFPSIGDGIFADKSIMQAKLLYDEGYSVVFLGSTCNWEFVKSMPSNYRPGLPDRDAQYLRTVTARVLEDVQAKHGCNFSNRIVVGTSFGALTGLFVAAQEEQENTLNVSRYLVINPPVETFFAINQVDKFAQEWRSNPSDIKERAAITVEKVLQKTQEVSDKNVKTVSTYFSFTDDEAKLILGFFMKQKLYDLVFAIENGSTSKKNKIYDSLNNMCFNDYVQKYILVNQTKPAAQVDYEASLYSISNFLQNSKNYKIYHSVDDYYTNPQQLAWLKKQAGSRALYFSNGSHLGELYRPEFISDFKKEISLKKSDEAKQTVELRKTHPADSAKQLVESRKTHPQGSVPINTKSDDLYPSEQPAEQPIEQTMEQPPLRPSEQPISEVKH